MACQHQMTLLSYFIYVTAYKLSTLMPNTLAKNTLTITLSEQSQHLPQLATDLLAKKQLIINGQATDAITIYQVIDAQGLACPMPLLKAKMALKHTPQGQAVYLLASDKNSVHDIAAFAKHANRQLWQAHGNGMDNDNIDSDIDSDNNTDTSQYHFILW